MSEREPCEVCGKDTDDATGESKTGHFVYVCSESCWRTYLASQCLKETP